MGKNKLSKFADMKEYPHVFECPLYYKNEQPPFALRGRWREGFFHNANPIVLELGCGKGEYTVGLAERYPERNFIGVDIKGARMWSGATEALEKGLTNVAFLRTSIEGIDKFFATGEVEQIWITFPDPQMKKYTKRLTSTPFLLRYCRILVPDGIIHLKTDSPFLYTYTDALLTKNQLPVEVNTTDDLNTIEKGINNNISVGTSSMVLPLNKVCEYIEPLSGRMGIRMYILWQVAKYGNRAPNFDEFTKCE